MCKVPKYNKAIRKLAEEESSDTFFNEGVEHASCLMSTIFDNSKDMSILSGMLNKNLTSKQEYFSSLEKFLANQYSTLKLLIENTPCADDISDALRLVYERSKHLPNVHVKVVSNKGKLITENLRRNNKGIPVHFAYADKQIYRFEYNSKEYMASASFNDKEISNKLDEIFNSLWDTADDFNIE